MDYLVSVIIPVYNRKDCIERCVGSVIKQSSAGRFQIILVDDGSTDGASEVCDMLAEKYSEVSAFHQQNAGVSAARNFGIGKAQGKWISFIDCDDYVLDGFYDELLMGEDADLLCCDFFFEEGGITPISEYIEEGTYYKKDFPTVLYPVMIKEAVFYSACNKIFKSKIIRNNDIQFVVGKKYAEDMTFVYDYVKHIESFKYINKKLYYYYFSPDSTSFIVSKAFETYKSSFVYKVDYFKDFDSDGKLFYDIRRSFLMNAMDSLYVASHTLRFFEAVKYVRSVLNDEVFRKNYLEKPIMAKGIFNLLNRTVLSNKPFLFVLFAKLNEARVNLLSK